MKHAQSRHTIQYQSKADQNGNPQFLKIVFQTHKQIISLRSTAFFFFFNPHALPPRILKPKADWMLRAVFPACGKL